MQLDNLGEVFIMIGRGFLTFFPSYIGYKIITMRRINSGIISPIGPFLCILMICYLIGTILTQIIGIAVDTIVQCYIIDEKI